MGKIILDDIKIFGYHGCLSEEKIIGSNFSIKLEIDLDFTNACIYDDLSETIDYTYLYKIVKEEMEIESKLIEHLAKRIITRIQKIEKIKKAKIKICKENPPLEGRVKQVCVILED
ncbi:dihydroneopterin aldolase [Blattabacterium cuenoti]|uniref:dihydroneopterin aldolase n=1 Tax=Blattabacterium cuenoti TaxID=1653831 RepID=UPI00163CC52D|nr:dihydroneopterin aldolase [Blattabacterium cuenoti]